MSSSSALSAVKLPAIHLAKTAAPAIKLAGATAPRVTANLSFAQSPVIGVDSTAALADANLESSTTSLGVNLSLKAGQKYDFSFYFASGGPKVSLVNSVGKSTAVTMSKGFTVPASGDYQLRFDAAYSLKDSANLANLKINAKSVLPTTSGDKRIDALLTGGTSQWWHGFDSVAVKGTDKIGSALGLAAGSSKTALTYSFLSSQPSGQTMTGFQPMTDGQKAAVRKAFDYYGSLINVSFTEVAGDGTGNINFGTNNQTNSAGYANLPNASSAKDKDFLYLANNAATNGDAGVQEGGYGYMSILHEIGHTLGLKHPGNYNAGGGGAPGPYLSPKEDDRQHTIMSYNDDNASRGATPSTAMLYDIAALQYLYGANKSASTAKNGAFTIGNGNTMETLWSTNGTDTLDLSAVTGASHVDLNAGTYSDINIKGAATSTSYSGNQNVAIAYGASVNKVTLSSRSGLADTVTLNDAFSKGKFDTITGFDATDDRINLKKSLFGAIKAENIAFDATMTNGKTKIIVNRTTGEIFYDADGSGTKSTAKKIAQYTALSGRGELSAASFVAVA